MHLNVEKRHNGKYVITHRWPNGAPPLYGVMVRGSLRMGTSSKGEATEFSGYETALEVARAYMHAEEQARLRSHCEGKAWAGE